MTTNPCAGRIRILLEQAFAPLDLSIEDESWKHAGHVGSRDHGGGHFRVHITSAKFAGKSTLQRHRMIHAVLQPLFAADIHALSLDARAPEER